MTGMSPNACLGRIDVFNDPNALGQVASFADRQWGAEANNLLSQTPTYAVLVENDSGGTLAPGSGCTFKAGAIGKSVGANSTANGICDGIVDPYLPAAVPNKSYFWLIIGGPCSVLVGTGGLTDGALLQTGATGTFVAGTAGTNPIGHSGRAAAAASATALCRVYLNLPFQAVRGC